MKQKWRITNIVMGQLTIPDESEPLSPGGHIDYMCDWGDLPLRIKEYIGAKKVKAKLLNPPKPPDPKPAPKPPKRRTVGNAKPGSGGGGGKSSSADGDPAQSDSSGNKE